MESPAGKAGFFYLDLWRTEGYCYADGIAAK